MLDALTIASVQSTGFRAGLETSNSVRSLAANPRQLQQAAEPSKINSEVTRYLSPIVSRDITTGQYVTLTRDSSSGDVVRQSPSELLLRMRLYAAAAEKNAERDISVDDAVNDVVEFFSDPALTAFANRPSSDSELGSVAGSSPESIQGRSFSESV